VGVAQMTTKYEIEFSNELATLIDQAFKRFQAGDDLPSSKPWIVNKSDFIRYVVMKGCQRIIRTGKD
jgi:hypothetical protein